MSISNLVDSEADSVAEDSQILGKSAVLSGLRLSYEPFIDKQRRTEGTRLTIRSISKPDQQTLGLTETQFPQLHQLWNVIADQWPEDGVTLSLDILPFDLNSDFLKNTMPHPKAVLEIPTNIIHHLDIIELLPELSTAGYRLALCGVLDKPLPEQLTSCFSYLIFNFQELRSVLKHLPKGIPFCIAGIDTISALDACFAFQPTASIGWPLNDLVINKNVAAAQHLNFQSLSDAIRLVDQNANSPAIERALRGDPALTFRLLRYINSAAFGRVKEVSSLREAILLLGYKPLKRWLSVMLATSVKDKSRLPVAYASLRRGLFLERLVSRSINQNIADDLFVVGVFSLLDKLIGSDLNTLLGQIPIAEKVKLTLLDNNGPYTKFLHLAQGTEHPEKFEVADLVVCQLSIYDFNDALFESLIIAQTLETQATG